MSEREFHVLATNRVTGEACLFSYTCQYPTLFGIDTFDKTGVEVLLDTAIRKVKGEDIDGEHNG